MRQLQRVVRHEMGVEMAIRAQFTEESTHIAERKVARRTRRGTPQHFGNAQSAVQPAYLLNISSGLLVKTA
jgi:hypothetical protein